MTLAAAIVMSITMASSLGAIAALIYGLRKGNVWLDKQITLTKWSSYIFIILLIINTLFTTATWLALTLDTITFNPF